MGVIRAEPARVTDWAARSIGAAWRAFDLQLPPTRRSSSRIGLVDGLHEQRRARPVGPRRRDRRSCAGLMWAGIALSSFIVATAFDYKWLKTFAWPLYVVQLGLLVLTLAIGTRRRRRGPLGLDRPVRLPVQRAREDPDDRRPGELPRRPQGRLGSLPSILGACVLVGPPWLLVMLQPDLGTSLVFVAILAGMLFMSGASLRWLGALAARVLAALPFVWNNVLRDYQQQRICVVPRPGAGHPGRRATSSTSRRSRSGPAAGSGKGLTNGTQNQLNFLPVQATDFVAAIYLEELGFLGAIVLLVLFARAALAGPRVAAGGRRTRSGRCSRRPRVDDPVPARSSTSGWSSGSCRSRASRCRS